MYADLKQLYFWARMRHNVADFVSICLECQRVKAEHHHSVGLLQPHTILEWKWDTISIDFIIGFPMSSQRHDCIMVIVKKLSKVAHFSPMRESYIASYVVHVFLAYIIHLCRIPHWIISNRDPLFTFALWMSLQHALGAQLSMMSSSTQQPIECLTKTYSSCIVLVLDLVIILPGMCVSHGYFICMYLWLDHYLHQHSGCGPMGTTWLGCVATYTIARDQCTKMIYGSSATISGCFLIGTLGSRV